MSRAQGVQMMGMRVGQVDEIIPVINGEKQLCNLRFVIMSLG